MPTISVESVNRIALGKHLRAPWQSEFAIRRRERKKTRRMHDLLYIDETILREVKSREKNLTIAWLDYKKAYDMTPQA